MIDKFLIINQILIQSLCSAKYNLWNLMYKILIHVIIEFAILVGPIAQEFRIVGIFRMTTFVA